MEWPPKNLDDLLRKAAEILLRAGAKEVYVFGSAVRGKMHERSESKFSDLVRVLRNR